MTPKEREAFEALLEVVQSAFGPVLGGPSKFTWAQTVERGYAALAQAEALDKEAAE